MFQVYEKEYQYTQCKIPIDVYSVIEDGGEIYFLIFQFEGWKKVRAADYIPVR